MYDGGVISRRAAVVVLVFVVACHHWVRVESPERVDDERVLVEHADGTVDQLEHAHACGSISIGASRAGQPPGCDCARTCTIINVARDRVRVRRINPWATTGLVAGIIVGVAAAFLVTVAAVGAGAAGG